MKTKLASVLGLAVFVASFICGGSLVYAETEETSSAMQIIATVADANGAESELSCVFDSAGADICTVTAKLEEVDEPLAIGGQETSSVMQIMATVADANGVESELSCVFDGAGADICTVTAKLEALDEPLAVGGPETSSVMQIIATGVDANGAESELSCVFDSAGADICPVIAKLEDVDEPLATAPAVEAVDAIVVEVSQSVTVAAPGQEAGDAEEPAHTGSISEPSVGEPVVMRDSPKD
jgi:hypothetical protein